MRCSQCDVRLGGLLGAFRARAISCPGEGCETVVCINCLSELAECRESGIGPLRRGVMEIRCPTCDTLLHRTEFPSELEQTAREVVGLGRKKVRELLVRYGRNTIQRQLKRGD